MGGDKQGIYLDMTHLGAEKILERLPQVRELALEFMGVDIIEEPVAIQPTAHYSMGGIPANKDGQVIADANDTPVVGFYAAGECACVSVHGANRLGTNSLLGASLFGRRAGRAMADFIQNGAELFPVNGDPIANNQKRIDRFTDDSLNGSAESVAQIAMELKTLMTNKVGVFRDQQRMSEALKEVKALQKRFRNARDHG